MATNIENKTLASILNKALNSINENQKHEFFNKWVYINYQNSIDKDTVLKLFILIFAYAGTIRTASRFTSGHSAGVDSDS